MTVLIMTVQEARATSPVCKALPEQDRMFLLPDFMNKNAMSTLSHKTALCVQPFVLETAPSLDWRWILGRNRCPVRARSVKLVLRHSLIWIGEEGNLAHASSSLRSHIRLPSDCRIGCPTSTVLGVLYMLTSFFLSYRPHPDPIQPRYKKHKPLIELLLTLSPRIRSEAWTEIRLDPEAELRLDPEAVSFLGKWRTLLSNVSDLHHADFHPLSLKWFSLDLCSILNK